MLRNHHHQQQQQQTNLDINDQQKIIHTLTPVPVTTEVQEEEEELQQQQQQQPKDSRPSSRIIDSKQQSPSPTTSSVNWIDHIEDYSNVDAMMTTTTTTHHQYHHHNHHHRNVYTSSSHHHHQAQQQQHQQQQQQPHLQPQPPNILKPSKGSINIIQTGGGGGSGSAVTASESAILQRENQKLASITRLCIHLVDRCRTLNKSKQFIKDLSRLGIMIEEFNRINTRKNSQLPTFSNGGLVCAKPETHSGGGSGSDSISKTVNTSTMSTSNIIGGIGGAATAAGSNNQIGDSTAAAGGMYFIPIINHQSFQQIQFIPANETTTSTTTAAGAVAAANPMIAFEKSGNIGKCSNKTKKSNLLAPGLMMMNPASMVHHQPSLQQQQQQQSQPNQQQSILFKKLTESGQLIDTTSMILQQTTNQQHQIPIHMNIGGSDENDQHSALFSIIPTTTNQSDDNLNRSDLEPDVKLDESDADGRGKTGGGGKIYRCNVCEKLFANSYNLNRHTKSHSGFQPYVCEYPDCYKKFNYNYHLKRHMETHTGARPFVCTWPDCDQRFNRKFNLNRHLWIHTEKESRMMSGRQKPESSHLLLSHSTKMTSSSSGMVAGGDGSTGGAT